MAAPQDDLITVLIVESNAALRSGLCMLIDGTLGMSVVGEACDGAEALSLAASTEPNIILLDLDLDNGTSVKLLPELLALAPGSSVIILTGLQDELEHRRAILSGARGLVLREQAVDTLISAIERVVAGGIWVNRTTVGSAISGITEQREPEEGDPEAERVARLTSRQRRLIALLSEGFSNKQLARRLSIAEKTVRVELDTILEKLGVGSRLELVIYAYQHHPGHISGEEK